MAKYVDITHTYNSYNRIKGLCQMPIKNKYATVSYEILDGAEGIAFEFAQNGVYFLPIEYVLLELDEIVNSNQAG